MAFFLPDLRVEVTMAIFYISGKVPFLNDELNIAASGLLLRAPVASFSNPTESFS